MDGVEQDGGQQRHREEKEAGCRQQPEEYIGPALDSIGQAVDKVRANWNYFFGSAEEAGKAMDASTDDWVSAGETIGQVLGGIVTVIGYVIAAIIEVVSAIV